MDDEIVYGLLEITFAKAHKIESGDALYNEKMQKLLPIDWYLLDVDDRVRILDEAISVSKEVTETKAYNELYQHSDVFMK